MSTLGLPDLSNQRFHSDVHHLTVNFPLAAVHRDIRPLVLAVFARLLGLYCAVDDVLLGIISAQGTVSPFQLSWNDETTWSSALRQASAALGSTQSVESVSTLSQLLEIKRDQCPFVAFFAVSTHTAHATPSLLYSPEGGFLSFMATSDRICSSVASTLLRQIAACIEHVSTDTYRTVASPLPLPDDLTSILEALPPDRRKACYSHIPPLQIATDCILPHVHSTPNATAVVWYPSLSSEDVMDIPLQPLSYFRLHSTANRFARFLLTRGLFPQDKVAVSMDRNLIFHTVLFGVLRAGACYVPIDPELPPERKRYIVQDSGAKFVIVCAQSQSPTLFTDLSINIDDPSIQAAIRTTSDVDLDPVSPNALAYMLYTSGTTGNPKGCLLTHEGLAEAIIAMSSFPAAVNMDDIRKGRYLAVASIAFDVHLAEVFVPLALGMTLCCARRSELLENLPQQISHLDITHVGLVPSLIDATMGAVEENELGGGIKLRYIASGGEKISDSILDKWADHPQVRLANFYGPSEVTIGCCARFMDSSTARANIGRAFANVSSYVVDSSLNILPRGAIGELVVAGPLVGRGYHGRPDLTAKAFLEWPHLGSWAYRTGDQVRMMPDGTLEILGRIDAQIKLRGVRIEAEGISAVLRKAARDGLDFQLDAGTILAGHPSIGNGDSPQLVSFVGWDNKVPVATRRSVRPRVISFPDKMLRILRAACEKELASYMRPAHVIPLSWLPLNSNGKADTKVLDGIFKEIAFDTLISFGQDTVTRTVATRPFSDVQQKLLVLLEKRIKVQISVVDTQTSLFTCGADSLVLSQFASDIRRTFQVPVSTADIMKNPSIEGVSALLGSSPSSARLATSVSFIETFSSTWLKVVQQAVGPLHVERVLPPFPVQEGVLYRSDSLLTSCVQHVIMKISDTFPLPRLYLAWEAAMKRLDVLRTVFHFGRELVQVILQSTDTQLPWREVSSPIITDDGFSDFFFAHEASSLSAEVNNAVSTIPPFRLNIYTGKQCRWLALSIHHALFDGISLPLILKYVEDEILDNSHAPAPSAEQLLEYIHGADPSAARSFWISKTNGFDWSTLRAMDISPLSQPQRKTVPIAMSLASLTEFVAPCQVTVQAALTCTFASLLAQYMYRSDDVIFGVIRSGRLLPVDGIEAALYPTLSVLPLRVQLDKKNCLQRTQHDISAAVSFEHFPLAQVQKWVRPGYSLFDTLFAVSVKDSTGYEVWEVVQSELSQPDFALSIEVLLDTTEDTVVIQAAYYDDGGYLESKVDQILARFEFVLLNILKNSEPIPSAVTLDQPSSTVQVPPERPNEPENEEGADGVTLDLWPLQEIVSRFLWVSPESVHPRTSFISLGLDSIRSVGLAKSLRQHGYAVTAADIMKHPSLQKLGVLFMRSSDRALTEESDGANVFLRNERERLCRSVDLSSFKLSTDDVVDVYPTTALQAGMLSQTVASSGRLYFHAFPLALETTTDLARFQKAWHNATSQLDILRTTFHYVPDLEVWIQIRHSIARLDWAEQSWKISKSLEDSVEEMASVLRPTDEMAFGRPPVYLRVLRSYRNKDHLVLFIHHALYDGLSIGNLLVHVERIYRQQKVQPPVQFFDILPRILLQQSHATAYWIRRLEHYRPASLPRINLPGTRTIIASRNMTFAQQELVRFVNDAAVTLQCLGQAAWAKFIASMTSSLDVVFGHVVSGRSVDDAEDVIGPMLNTVPCCVQFSPPQSNRDLLRSIHRENVDAIPWQHVSLRAVQNEMGFPRLWSSLFLFQPRTSESTSPESDKKLWSLYDSGEFDTQIQYPLNVELHETGSGFMVTMACSPNFMDSQRLEGALMDLEALLRDIIYHPEHTAIPALSPGVSANEAGDNRMEIKSAADEQLRTSPELLRILASMTPSASDRLNPAQSLAALGIDSITAISLRSKCKKAGLTLSIADIVSSRTIRELVSKVKAGVDAESVAVEPSATVIPVSEAEYEAVVERFPEELRSRITSVSLTTEGMKWLIGAWQRSQRTRFQHVFAYRLGRDVDLAKLREAWKALLAYHPILRSTAASAPGRRASRIVTFAVEAVDASLTEEIMEVEDLHALAVRMKHIVSSPLPASAPQMKGTIVTSCKDRYLLIRMHHFQYDAFSLELLLDDLNSMYQGASPRSSRNLAAFLTAFAPTELQLMEQRAYWESVMPIPFVPEYFPSMTKGRRDDTRLPQRTVITVKSAVQGAAALENTAQQNGLPLYVVLLSCWASTQASYTASDTVVFGLWHAGRTGDVEGIEKLAVPCMNVLPVHVAVLEDLCKTARRLQEDLYKRTPVVQQSSLEKVDEWVTGGKGIPLTNVSVNVFKIARDSNSGHGLFESVEVDYAVPTEPPSFEETVIDELPISKLIQDDVMIDIVIDEKLDAITMSIESAAAVVDGECAVEMINNWVSRVENCLPSGINES